MALQQWGRRGRQPGPYGDGAGGARVDVGIGPYEGKRALAPGPCRRVLNGASWVAAACLAIGSIWMFVSIR